MSYPEVPATTPHTEVLERVYKLVQEGKIDPAVDVALCYLDNLMHAGKFEVIDRLFETIDLDRLGNYVIVTFVVYPRCCEEKLKSYDAFKKSAHNWFLIHRGPSATDRIFENIPV